MVSAVGLACFALPFVYPVIINSYFEFRDQDCRPVNK